MDEFVPQRTSAYISQYDTHTGEMTVRETLAFSARCQGVGARYEMLKELSRREKEANIKPDPDLDVFMKAAMLEGQKESVVTDYILKILGLEVCADTMVGDQMLRGISGGQKKRVTIGEMLVGPAKTLFMDEISTGLDSSTTFQIVNSLRQSIHILGGTAVVALLQPAPETYNLFDDIILLSDGQIVYQGPREHVLEFFESMGFKCPDRKGVADFLQEVTSRKDQQQYWTIKDEPYRFISVKEFADEFQSFHVGSKIGDDLDSPFDKSMSHPAALTTSKYGISKMELLKTCASREWLLMKRNSFVYIFKMVQIIVVAFVTMTVFIRTEMHRDSVIDGGIFMGVLFYSLIKVMFNGFSDLSMTVARLPVFYKQRDLLLYPPWAYSLPKWILSIPISVSEVAAWVAMSYYVIGFDPNIGRMFKQYLLLLSIGQMASGLFLFIAALGRNMIIANTFGSFALLAIMTLGGFIVSRAYKEGQAVLSEEVLMEKHMNKTGDVKGLLKPSSRGEGSASATSTNGFAKTKDTKKKTKRGMVLPFVPLSLAFDNIKYSIDMPPEMKKRGMQDDRLMLLKGVSGAFRPGVLTALMGVSGAGKTTLMDVLAGRKTGGYIEGNISISGYPKKQETFARISGYCEQNDIHSPHVTVYESLLYSAWLRLPSEVDSATKKMFIEEVMELVELTSLRESLVGLPGVNGLSTEQRKRLTIAVELVANPSIIFMDEPTSGLDARAAAIVMRTVRNTVDTGRTVVCTIHQPSIDIFESFDELFLMKRGGEEIYVGPLGHHSCHLIKYFEEINGVSKIKDDHNPATWMLEVTTISQEDILGVKFVDTYKNSNLYQRNKALIKELSSPPPGSKDLYFPTQFSQSFITQCVACLWKQHMSYWHNPQYNAVRFFFTTFVALMIGTIFWNLGSKTGKRQDLFNAMGSMYAAILFIGIRNAFSVQPVVAIERTVFYRERAAGMYSALPYAFAQVAIEIPYVFLQTVIYGVIVYAMIAFEWTAPKFFWYLYFMFFTLLYFTYYGMMAVGLTPNQNISAIVSSAFYSIWNVFSGFLIPRPRIPLWWRWYYWACPIAWTLYGMVASQFGDIQEPMESGETVADFVRVYFGFQHDFLGVVSAAIVGFSVLFAFVFAFSIKTLNFQRR
ncbi:ABC transporter G family member 39-like protein [Cinnamomum micranthum f. kanehirae]|uniref:ABC transporter G family member 39-like protein n=1 Tax=Cinnamomum micranthum f. kanehirae TaxID=337451 RepID=A0A3S3MNT1_9MAGN|nr:ABC transporter G family member 39-like protein [Cinnamomum micranthum f. kanehirae]